MAEKQNKSDSSEKKPTAKKKPRRTGTKKSQSAKLTDSQQKIKKAISGEVGKKKKDKQKPEPSLAGVEPVTDHVDDLAEPKKEEQQVEPEQPVQPEEEQPVEPVAEEEAPTYVYDYNQDQNAAIIQDINLNDDEPSAQPAEPEPETEPEAQPEPEATPEPQPEQPVAQPETQTPPGLETTREPSEPESEPEPEKTEAPQIEPEPIPPDLDFEPPSEPVQKPSEQKEPSEQTEEPEPQREAEYESTPYQQHQDMVSDEETPFNEPEEAREDQFRPPEPAESEPVEAETIEEGEIVERSEESETRSELDERQETQREVNNILDSLGQGDRGSIGQQLKNVFSEISPYLGKIFNFKCCGCALLLMILIGVGYFGFTQNWQSKITDYFQKKTEPPKEERQTSDQFTMISGGLSSAQIFGANGGAFADLIPDFVRIADIYGTLSEAKLAGETGITAATYFGQLKDNAQKINDYIDYVRFLSDLKNLYEIDVYKLLDSSSERSKTLFDYLDQLKKADEQGKKNVELMGLYVDDLTASYNSLAPDKAQAESDFFNALSQVQAEKSDSLLKSFVDMSQKQVALKARIAALNKLITYYQAALANVEKRIKGIDLNSDAIIHGIHIVEVPGSGINLIIRSQ